MIPGAVVRATSPLAYEGRQVAVLENWYSPTCGTHWAQIRMPAGWEARVEMSTQTARDCEPMDCQTLNHAMTPPLWTNMLFAVNQPTVALAYVKLPTGEVKKLEASTAGP